MATPQQTPEISFLPLGALLQDFVVGGIPVNLALPSQGAYEQTTNPAFLGETIGRVANRIKAARFSLNGKTYSLPTNNGKNTLHGGHNGWGKKIWSGPHPESRNGTEAVRFEYTSPDGDEGFPGKLLAKVWYTSTIDAQGKTELGVEYEVKFADDDTSGVQETVVNVTNHSTFSVGPVLKASAGETQRSLEGTKIKLFTDQFQEVDIEGIPSGAIKTFPEYKAGQEVVLGKTERVFDDCFVFPTDSDPTWHIDTRGQKLRQLMSASHPETGVTFEAWSTEPAFQFYTGEYVDVDHEGTTFGKRSGFACEASRYVDALNHEKWKGQVVLRRGETYGSKTVYKAWKA